MIVKLIRCHVDLKEQFAEGQRSWHALASADGFFGQTGGWSDSGEAVVVGLWRDGTAYRAFMRDVHDGIYESSGQKGSCRSIDTSLWESVLDMPGKMARLPSAVAQGGYLRIALCGVKEDRRRHFEQMQRDVWNPGMGEAPGMLAGVFCRHMSDPLRYLVCTLWQSAGDHSRYMAEVFPPLRAQVDFETDGTSLEGLLVETKWRVEADSS